MKPITIHATPPIEDDGVDDDGRREDEIEDEPEHLEGFDNLVLILADKSAAYLRRQNKPNKLDNMLVEMSGLINTEDVEERGTNGHDHQIENTCDHHAKEHLSHHMECMCRKGTIVQLLVADNEQNGCQDISEPETVGLKEWLQIESQ